MSDSAVTETSSREDLPTVNGWFVWGFRFGCRQTTRLIWFLVAFGLAFRFTVRDQYYPWALILYVTPIPSLPIWMFLAGIASAIGRTPKPRPTTTTIRSRVSLSRSSLILGMLFLPWVFFSECVDRAKPESSLDLRLAFWNVARVQAGFDRLTSQLKSFNPSVIGLVEADQEHEVDLDEWKRHFPEYEVVGTSFGGLIAVKGKVVSHQLHHLASASFCEQFDVRVDQNDFAVLLVDITSDFRKSRQRPLLALATLANDLADRPVVIMGDFNTPDDSIWLASLQEHHREAFRERGTGYAATWPMPLPVLTLDQVWVNEFVEVSRCVHHWTIDSDHRPVVSDVSFHVPN